MDGCYGIQRIARERILLLGWLLIRRSPRTDWHSEFAPERILSPCDCLCEVHPNYDDWTCDDGRSPFMLARQRNGIGGLLFLDSPASAEAMAVWLGDGFACFGVALPHRLAHRLEAAHNPAYRSAPLQPQLWRGKERLLG